MNYPHHQLCKYIEDNCTFYFSAERDCRNAWKHIRDGYTANRRRSKGKSGAGRDEVPCANTYKYAGHLRFLDDTLGNDATTSSHPRRASPTSSTLSMDVSSWLLIVTITVPAQSSILKI